MEDLHVVFRGTVQGVGFRARAAQLARTYPGVAGTIQNRPDGTVALSVVGERRDLEAFLRRLREQLKDHIASETLNWSTRTTPSPPSGLRVLPS